MNRTDLIAVMSASAGIPKSAAERALNAALDAVLSQLQHGGHVTLAGFGSFRVIARRARKGRNPQTGAIIPIEPCRTVKFSVSDELKQAINGSH